MIFNRTTLCKPRVFSFRNGNYIAVSAAGMHDLMSRCDASKLDLEDRRTWGDVNWLSYRAHQGELLVIYPSYEASRTGGLV